MAIQSLQIATLVNSGIAKLEENITNRWQLTKKTILTEVLVGEYYFPVYDADFASLTHLKNCEKKRRNIYSFLAAFGFKNRFSYVTIIQTTIIVQHELAKGLQFHVIVWRTIAAKHADKRFLEWND